MNKWAIIGILCFLSGMNTQAQNMSPQLIQADFKEVAAIELVSLQNILVLDRKSHQLIELDASGNVLDRIGDKGSGSYQFSQPTDLATTTGLKRFVADFGNQRIQLFDKRGQLLGSVSKNASYNELLSFSPTLLAVNTYGEIITYNSEANEFLKFSENGALLDRFNTPEAIKSVNDIEVHNSKLFILDSDSEVVHELTENGLMVSFFPAENTLAIRVIEGELYLLKESHIEKLRGSKRSIIARFPKQLHIHLFDLHQGRLILASKNALYTLNYELEE